MIFSGGLFTQYFLRDGIRNTSEYGALDAATVAQRKEDLAKVWHAFVQFAKPSEAHTEAEFIYPVLGMLGWTWLVQPAVDRQRRDVADALLFLDSAAKQRAAPLPAIDRIRHGVAIVENEARFTHLERASSSGEAPASQLLRYLSRADVQSERSMRWGVLTNGGLWRLYYDRVASRAEGYVQCDLAQLLDPLPLAPPNLPEGAPADHWIRVFLLLFRPSAFAPSGEGGPSFLIRAVERSQDYRARITAELSSTVFQTVFPRLLRALAENDPQADVTDARWLGEAREGAIRLLYRLLFVLYAEDRALLPMEHDAYRRHSLRQVREQAARDIDAGQSIPALTRRTWHGLGDIFRAISEGERALGVPEYNGSLFRDRPGDILLRITIPDRALVPIIDAMSREASGQPLINFRDLDVQHLGSIYERLLEQEVVPNALSQLELRPQPYARKNSGSFYTPDELVDLILRQTIEPLVQERRVAFDARLAATPGDLPALLEADPASAILSLRVCDPAMGSGHFLVALVDRLTDLIRLAMADASAKLPGGAYTSPLAADISAMRERIQANATAGGWTLDGDTLDDKHIIRRMVLKRCVFGVDLNPMAVELAKLSLWLHSFTIGAPLSFLDHHLRCGDSLFGEFVGPAMDQLESQFGMVPPDALRAAQQAASDMVAVETRPDLDAAEVRESREQFERVEGATASLRAFLDLYHAMRWVPQTGEADHFGRQLLLQGHYGDPVALLGGAPLRPPVDRTQRVGGFTGRRVAPITSGDAFDAAQSFLIAARSVLEGGRFFHWEVAFLGVWPQWVAGRPSGGFDAVIGNPPWDRMKMQEVEWWAERQDAVARLSRAADRKLAIAALRQAGTPLAIEYDRAAARRKRAAEVARALPKRLRDGSEKGAYALYPLFAKGDVNLYALFTERAGQLVADAGVVGLLVPSGVAADKGAAQFFRSITGSGRLKALLDFENRRPARGLEPFFPAVDSRFKFSAFIHGGIDRHYAEARCAFFQDDAVAAERNAFAIAPAEFTLVNPNTGTAPVFRSPANARRVLDVYGRLPVLRVEGAPPAYPVAYATQLHMTNDSGLFRSAEELEAEGAYPVAGGVYERGNIRYRPLMVGRSIHLYDHRFASVMEDEPEEAETEDEEEEAAPAPRRVRRPTRTRRIHNPYTSRQTSAAEHARADYLPRPRFWVEETELAERWPEGLEWAVGFRDIARPTDVRTVIAAVVPRAAFGNTVPLLLPADPADWEEYRRTAPLLLGNLGSLVLDYIARNKVQSTHLNNYILEQLPLVPPSGFNRRFGSRSAEEIVRAEVLALTYTAENLRPFALDQGHAGPPFIWDEEDRLRRRARLDAVFFLLFGMDRITAGAVIDTFPIIRREEEHRFGRFRSRDLILRMMAALEAGNPDAQVEG